MPIFLRWLAVFALMLAQIQTTISFAAAEGSMDPDMLPTRAKRATAGIEAPTTIVVDPIWKPAGRFVIWKKAGQTLEHIESCPAAFVLNPYLIVTTAHCVVYQLAKGRTFDGRQREKVKVWEPNPDLSAYKCVFYQNQNGEIFRPEVDERHPADLRWDIDCSKLASAFPNSDGARYSDLIRKTDGEPQAGSDALDYAFIPVKKRPEQPPNVHFYDLAMAKDNARNRKDVQIFGYPSGKDNQRRGARVVKGKLQAKKGTDKWITFKSAVKLPAEQDYNLAGLSGGPWVFPGPNKDRFSIVGVYAWEDSEVRSPEFNDAVKQKAVEVANTIRN